MKRLYKTEFHTAHHIEGHEKCGRTHGHSYQLRVEVDFDEFEWVDFTDLKSRIEVAIEPYDHCDIGDITCERLARILQTRIKSTLKPIMPEDYDVTVELWETSHFGVRI